MLRYTLRRLSLLLITLAMASLLIFLITDVLPGDVGRIILGPFATQEAVDQLNRELGMDRPLLVRYVEWLGNILQGDWGRSLSFETPVLALVMERFARSLLLALVSLAVLIPLAVLCGVLAARREGSLFDRAASVIGLTFGAIPEFVTGVFLIVIFSVWLGVLPVQALPAEGAGPGTWLVHLIMPAATLILLLFAYLFRMTRASTIEALAADYTRTAVLKGLPEHTVIRRHVLRNALLPTITVIGAQLGWIVGGLVVVETLFRYPGIGSLIHFAATNKDIPLLVGCSLAITFVFAFSNLAADVLYAALNPRVRHAMG